MLLPPLPALEHLVSTCYIPLNSPLFAIHQTLITWLSLQEMFWLLLDEQNLLHLT